MATERKELMYFVDTETVPTVEHFRDLDERLQKLFIKKFKAKIDEELKTSTVDAVAYQKVWQDNAGMSPEFGKIICISTGAQTQSKFWVKSFAGRHEKEILKSFGEAMKKNNPTAMVAHNGTEFDYPFLFRRFIINGLPVPNILWTFGKKVYELTLFDTVKIWSHTAWNQRVSLDLLAALLNIPSPKTDLDGSKVAEVYFRMFDDVKPEDLPFEKEKEVIGRIATYCNNDVVTLAKIWSAIHGTPFNFEVIIVDEENKTQTA